MSDTPGASPGEGNVVRSSSAAVSDRDEPPLVLVVGATGYIGQRLVPRLLASGYRVRALVRSVDRARLVLPPACELHTGDVLAAETLPEALRGVQAIVYLVHTMTDADHEFEARDRVGANNVGRLAAEAGVRRIVYLGGLGDPRTKLSRHLRSRQEVGTVLASHGVLTTELRAGPIIGAGSASFEILRTLVERLLVMVHPRWVATRCQPIAVDDVLAYLLAALAEPLSAGRILEIGGPDVLTYGEMMRRVGDLLHLRRFTIGVPLLSPRLSSYWIDVVTSMPASLARPLVEGLSSEVIVRDPLAQELLPLPLTSFDVAARRALAEPRPEPAEPALAWLRRVPRRLGGIVHDALIPPAFRDTVTVVADVPPDSVFQSLSRIGGANGWYAYDWAWQLRGWLDRIVGGPGLMRRVRRNADPRPGDRVDFWTVLEAERPRRLRLRALMRLPGQAELEWEIAPVNGSSVLIQTARFVPDGARGRAYWYALLPLHGLIFTAMARAIVERARRHARLHGRAA